jgi:dihydroxy-acid dehydratase
VHSETLGKALDHWDVTRTNSEMVHKFYSAAPGGVPTQVAFSQERRFDHVDTDREKGVIRSKEHSFRQMAVWPCFTAISLKTAAS